MKLRTILLAAGMVVPAWYCPGQKPPPSPTPVSKVPPVNQNPTNPTPQSGLNQDLSSRQRGIYVTGRVQLDDGGPVPMEARIERVCGGKRVPLGYPDRKGRFSVTLAPDQSALGGDADYEGAGSSRVSTTPLVGCELQANLTGYRSDSINMGSVHALDNPNVGTIVLHRLGGQQGGGTVSAALLNAPKGALKDYERGMESLRKANPSAADKSFQKAVDAYPPFAPAWLELGRLTAPSDQKLAREDFEKAMAADPKFLPPFAELSAMLMRQKNWREAIEVTDRALSMDSAGFPELYYFSATAHFNLRQLDDAEKRARETLKVDAEHKFPRAKLLLGYVLADKGDYRGAADELKEFVAASPNAGDIEKTRSTIAQLEARIGNPSKPPN